MPKTGRRKSLLKQQEKEYLHDFGKNKTNQV